MGTDPLPSKRAALALAVLLTTAGAIAAVALGGSAPQKPSHAAGYAKTLRPHLDHQPLIPAGLTDPKAVTRACLECHPKATHVMSSSHWQWLGEEVRLPGRPGPVRMGKKNLINNFCIGTVGNEAACTKCHIGYGWADAKFDFNDSSAIDCLICHEQTNTYSKGVAGMPAKGTDLVAAARSVATPSRDNCLSCHAYGGGGQAVKHGDIDSSLVHPATDEDVHMGKLGFLCVDCHKTSDHQLRGRAFSVSVEDAHGVACTDCHTGREHADARIETHLKAVACQTCHVPTFARTIPTKATWDWSKAGDKDRKDDPHEYLKIKGEFTYEQDVVPEYRWFNLTTGRYLQGDKIDPAAVTVLNPLGGNIGDPTAKIWPFKIHRGEQPYDAGNNYLFVPVTGGKDGYWTNFDWDNAFRLGETTSGLAYSGKFGFAKTEMFWPLTHMVTPKEKALACADCHGDRSRLDWKALGYPDDPIKTGGRR